jgi:hypothetical protein
MSPAAQAARAFPSASQWRERRDYQGNLEAQIRKDTLKREELATKDTPEARMARDQARIASREFIALSQLDQKNRYLEFRNTWESNKLSQHALDTLERSGNAGMAEILKNFRVEMLNDPSALDKLMANPNSDQARIILGAMNHAHQLVNRGPITAPAPPAQPPAAGAPATGAPAPAQAPLKQNEMKGNDGNIYHNDGKGWLPGRAQ